MAVLMDPVILLDVFFQHSPASCDMIGCLSVAVLMNPVILLDVTSNTHLHPVI